MSSLAIPSLSDATEIHPQWRSRWAPALTDPILRERIAADPRFADRIARDLTGIWPASGADAKEGHDADADALRTIERFGDEGRLRRIGLMWLAPRLVLCLMNRETRDACGRLSRTEIRDVLAFRDHLKPDRIGQLPDAADVPAQGWQCLLSWALDLGSPLSARLRLSLSPEDVLSIGQTEERARFFGGVLRHQDAGEI